MYYINLTEKMLKDVIKVAKENNDLDLAKVASMINSAVRLAKYEEQGLLCSKCGMAVSEEMAEVTQGMCQCLLH